MKIYMEHKFNITNVVSFALFVQFVMTVYLQISCGNCIGFCLRCLKRKLKRMLFPNFFKNIIFFFIRINVMLF